MYSNATIQKYLNDLAARLPAPGGGSAAALAGAMAAALIEMVLNFTIGNEKYKAFEEEARKLLNETEVLRQNFIRLFEEDIKSYEEVSKAYKMPKTTEDEKAKRKAAKDEALKQALLVPFEVCKNSVAAIKGCPILAKDANPNLICDVEVPVRLLEAAFYSAKINVVMNQKGIGDVKFNKDIDKQLKDLEKQLLRYKKIAETEVAKVIKC